MLSQRPLQARSDGGAAPVLSGLGVDPFPGIFADDSGSGPGRFPLLEATSCSWVLMGQPDIVCPFPKV